MSEYYQYLEEENYILKVLCRSGITNNLFDHLFVFVVGH